MKHRWLQTSSSPSVVLLPAVRTSCWNLVEIQILMIAGQKLEGDIFMQEPFSNPWVIETGSHLSQLCCLGLVPQVVWDWKKSVTLGSSFSCLVEGLYSHTALHIYSKKIRSYFVFTLLKYCLIYNILNHAVQQWLGLLCIYVIYMYLCILFHILFRYNLSHDTESVSLCFAVGPCLSILCEIVCIYLTQTLRLFLSHPTPLDRT